MHSIGEICEPMERRICHLLLFHSFSALGMEEGGGLGEEEGGGVWVHAGTNEIQSRAMK